MWLVWDDENNPNWGHGHFLETFSSYVNILFIIKMKFIFLFERSQQFSQLCQLSSLDCSTIFKHVLQLFYTLVLLVSILYFPLSFTHHSNIDVQLWQVTKLGMLTYVTLKKRPLNAGGATFMCRQLRTRSPVGLTTKLEEWPTPPTNIGRNSRD